MGGVFWIPVLLIFISYWLLSKMKTYPPITWMLAVLIGHTLWMTVGHASLLALDKPDPDLIYLFPDVIIVALITIWAIKKESMASCVTAIIYQTSCLIIYATDFDHFAKFGALAMSMHTALRVIGLSLAAIASFKLWRSKELPVSPSKAGTAAR